MRAEPGHRLHPLVGVFHGLRGGPGVLQRRGARGAAEMREHSRQHAGPLGRWHGQGGGDRCGPLGRAEVGGDGHQRLCTRELAGVGERDGEGLVQLGGVEVRGEAGQGVGDRCAPGLRGGGDRQHTVQLGVVEAGCQGGDRGQPVEGVRNPQRAGERLLQLGAVEVGDQRGEGLDPRFVGGQSEGTGQRPVQRRGPLRAVQTDGQGGQQPHLRDVVVDGGGRGPGQAQGLGAVGVVEVWGEGGQRGGAVVPVQDRGRGGHRPVQLRRVEVRGEAGQCLDALVLVGEGHHGGEGGVQLGAAKVGGEAGQDGGGGAGVRERPVPLRVVEPGGEGDDDPRLGVPQRLGELGLVEKRGQRAVHGRPPVGVVFEVAGLILLGGGEGEPDPLGAQRLGEARYHVEQLPQPQVVLGDQRRVQLGTAGRTLRRRRGPSGGELRGRLGAEQGQGGGPLRWQRLHHGGPPPLLNEHDLGKGLLRRPLPRQQQLFDQVGPDGGGQAAGADAGEAERDLLDQ